MHRKIITNVFVGISSKPWINNIQMWTEPMNEWYAVEALDKKPEVKACFTQLKNKIS